MERIQCGCGRILNVGLVACPVCGRPTTLAQRTLASLHKREEIMQGMTDENIAQLMNEVENRIAFDETLSTTCTVPYSEEPIDWADTPEDFRKNFTEVVAKVRAEMFPAPALEYANEAKWTPEHRVHISKVKITKAQLAIQKLTHGNAALWVRMGDAHSFMIDLYNLMVEAKMALNMPAEFLEANIERFKDE